MNQRIQTVITATLLILVLSWAGASADVLNVPSTDYETIQSALDDAFPGDQIVIAEGRYEENLTISKGGLEIVGAGVDKTIVVGKADSYHLQLEMRLFPHRWRETVWRLDAIEAK